MATSLFSGSLVRLVAPNPETDADAFARWALDSEFQRLEDSGPARTVLSKSVREEMEQQDS